MVFKFQHKNSKDIHFLNFYIHEYCYYMKHMSIFTHVSTDTIYLNFHTCWYWYYVWTFTHVSTDTIWRICQLSHMWALILYVWLSHVWVLILCLNSQTCEHWYYMFELSQCEYQCYMTCLSTCITCHKQTEAPMDHSPKHILFPCIGQHL